jgi:hypothetical protein
MLLELEPKSRQGQSVDVHNRLISIDISMSLEYTYYSFNQTDLRIIDYDLKCA